MFKFHVITPLCVMFVLQVFSQEAGQPKFIDAVLITGGDNSSPNTAELYVPSTGLSCSLPQLPLQNYGHTLESSGLLCGGVWSDVRDTCLQWSPDTGSWLEELTLDTVRYYHVSWTPDNGIGTYLMGGYGSSSERTSTLVKNDGTQEAAFPLKYDTDSACAIPQEDSVIVTGGSSTRTTVSVYNTEGWLENLPPLNTGRYRHACSSFRSGERRVLMVTGGYTGSDRLDSTETLDTDGSSWVTSTAKLPRPIYGLRAVNIDDRVLIFGGNGGGYRDDILEYDIMEDTIHKTGSMLQTREDHAVSVVPEEDYSMWCQ